MVFLACSFLVLRVLLLLVAPAHGIEVLDVKRGPLPASLAADMEDEYNVIGPEFFATSVGPELPENFEADLLRDEQAEAEAEATNTTALEAGADVRLFSLGAVASIAQSKPKPKAAKVVPKAWHQAVKNWNQVCWWGRIGRKNKCWHHQSCRFEVFIRNYSLYDQVSPPDSFCGKGLLDNLRGECNCRVYRWQCYAFQSDDGAHGIWAQFSLWPWSGGEFAISAIPRAVLAATGGEVSMPTKLADCCGWGDTECFNNLNFPGLIHPYQQTSWAWAMKKIVTCLYYDCPAPQPAPRLLAIGA